GTGARFGDDLDVAIALQQRPQPLAERLVIVDERDAHAHQTCTSIRVPSPRRLSIVKRPPRNSARSRMVSSPRPVVLSASASKPTPSSAMVSENSGACALLTRIAMVLAPVRLTQLVSASWTMRNRLDWTAGGSGRVASRVSSWTLMPAGGVNSCAEASRAGLSP